MHGTGCGCSKQFWAPRYNSIGPFWIQMVDRGLKPKLNKSQVRAKRSRSNVEFFRIQHKTQRRIWTFRSQSSWPLFRVTFEAPSNSKHQTEAENIYAIIILVSFIIFVLNSKYSHRSQEQLCMHIQTHDRLIHQGQVVSTNSCMHADLWSSADSFKKFTSVTEIKSIRILTRSKLGWSGSPVTSHVMLCSPLSSIIHCLCSFLDLLLPCVLVDSWWMQREWIREVEREKIRVILRERKREWNSEWRFNLYFLIPNSVRESYWNAYGI